MTIAKAEEEFRRWAGDLRSFHPELWTGLREHLAAMRREYTDRAINGPIDNGLTIGFVRGIDRVQKLVEESRS